MAVPIPLPIKTTIHTHAKHVYTWGEHGCAVAYAIHEFLGYELIVITLSGVLKEGFMRKRKAKLKFFEHWLVTGIEQAVFENYSVLRDMRTMGYSRKYEIMDPEGIIVRLPYFKDVKRYIEEKINA